MHINLRPATQEDVGFVFRVERETMRAYAIATWGVWHEVESRDRAMSNTLAGLTQVIELGEVPVGVFRVERTTSSIDLHQIYLLPAFQRRGIGAEVLRTLMREAEDTRLPLKLRVLKVNPAIRFYEHLGFTAINSSAEHIHMVYAL